MGYRDDDTLYSCLPLNHVHALFASFLPAVLAGAQFSFAERFSASRYWHEMDATRRAALNVIFDEEIKDKLTVDEVTEGGAGEKAGIEAGDVVKKFAGTPVKSATDIREMLSSYNPGDKVKVELDRDGEKKTVELKLAKRTSKQ